MKRLTRILLLAMTACCVPLSSSVSGQTRRPHARQKTVDIFSNQAAAIEESKLRQMSAANKAKTRKAINALETGIVMASLSKDMEEIAGLGSKATDNVNAAQQTMPNGAMKGAMISCEKALGHSYYLRLVNSGGLDSADSDVAKFLEEITLRYQLASIPAYERPAKVLDYARAHLRITREIALRAGIISK